MDIKKVYRSIELYIIVAIFLLMTSCGPMVWTTGFSEPPPPWFYPNRLEVVRYVYFPEYHFYYDHSTRDYLYLDAGIWVRHKVLHPRYSHLNLRRLKYERIREYRSDDIRKYHEENNINRARKNNSNRGIIRNPKRRNN